MKEDIMSEATMKIDGMTCQHCVMRVKKAVEQVPGVARTEVAIGTARITYDESQVKEQDLEQAVEKAGYKVRK
jgi:copper chaperone CopZ